MLWVSTALAGTVMLADNAACIDEEVLRLELSEALPDAQRAALDISVWLDPTHQLELDVSSRGREVWSRVEDVDPADCEVLPRFIARSVERGLASLPGWGLPDVRRKAPVEVGPTVMLSVGAGTNDWRGAFGVGALGGIGRSPLRWEGGGELGWSAALPVGEGFAQLIAFGFGPGIGVDGRLSEQSSLRFSVVSRVGPALVFGRGFEDNQRGMRLRVWARPALGLNVGPMRTALGLEVAPARIGWVDVETGESNAEALLRGVLTIGAAGVVGRGLSDR